MPPVPPLAGPMSPGGSTRGQSKVIKFRNSSVSCSIVRCESDLYGQSGVEGATPNTKRRSRERREKITDAGAAEKFLT